MAMDPVHEISPGREVFTLDGERLGRVKEVQEHAIKVDAALRPDFWLPRERVLSFTNERVTMDFDQADLGRHTLADDQSD